MNPRKIKETNQLMLTQQKNFQIAADYVTSSLKQIDEVEKIVLFSSIAHHLKKEVPRFREFRRADIEVCHECKDVDIAVWLSGLNILRTLQKACSKALNRLLQERNIAIAHHQVDVFIFEPETNRYLGRLCNYNTCPKGKDDCLVPGCGEIPLLKQHDDFTFKMDVFESDSNIVLFDRSKTRHSEKVAD